MQKQSMPEFINSQVRLLIKKYPDKTIGELINYAKIEFPVFKWDYNKIRNAVNRINKSANIRIEKIICVEPRTKNNQNRMIKRLRLMIVNDTTK